MSGTNDLVVWLTGVLDDTAAVAVAASRDDSTAWTVSSPGHGSAVEADCDVVVYDEGRPTEEQASHIALHDPRAVLARVEAERGVLRAYARLCAERDETYTDHVEYPPDEHWVGTSQHMMELAVGKMRRGVIEPLAWGHRHDAPGYDPAWAPEGVRTETTT